MQQYRGKRAPRSEFKAVKQMENEISKDYFRRVRYLGDLALSENSLTEREQDLRGLVLEGLFDFRLQQKLYEVETDRNFCEFLYRAQELELNQKILNKTADHCCSFSKMWDRPIKDNHKLLGEKSHRCDREIKKCFRNSNLL